MTDRPRKERLGPRIFGRDDTEKAPVMFNYKEDSKPPNSNQRIYVSEEGYEYRDTRPILRDSAMKYDKRGIRPKTLDELDKDYAYREHGYEEVHLTKRDMGEFERGFKDRLVDKKTAIESGVYGKKKISGAHLEKIQLSTLPPSAGSLFGNFDVTVDGEDEFVGFPEELRRVFRTNKNCLPIACLLRPRVLKRKKKMSLPSKTVRKHIWEMARYGMAHRTTCGRLGNRHLELLFQFTAILKGEDAQQVNAPLHEELEHLTENTIDQTIEARMILHLYLEIDEQATMEVDEVLEEEEGEEENEKAQYMREEEGVEIEEKINERKKAEDEKMMNTYLYRFKSFRFSME